MAHPLVLLKYQKGIAALYPSRVVISFTNTAKRHDTASLMKLSVLATLGGIDAASPMAHSSTTFILARRLRLQGQAPYRRQTLLRSVAVGAACGMAINPKVEAFGH